MTEQIERFQALQRHLDEELRLRQRRAEQVRVEVAEKEAAKNRLEEDARLLRKDVLPSVVEAAKMWKAHGNFDTRVFINDPATSSDPEESLRHVVEISAVWKVETRKVTDDEVPEDIGWGYHYMNVRVARDELNALKGFALNTRFGPEQTLVPVERTILRGQPLVIINPDDLDKAIEESFIRHLGNGLPRTMHGEPEPFAPPYVTEISLSEPVHAPAPSSKPVMGY